MTRPGCHLCDIVRPVLVGETAAAGVAWTEVSLSERPDLEARFGELVPVTLIDGFIHDYWRLDRERLRAALGLDGSATREDWLRVMDHLDLACGTGSMTWLLAGRELALAA